MEQPNFNFEFISMILGLFLSFGVLIIAYRKYHKQRTIFRYYQSHDICVFYQFIAHASANCLFILINNPPFSLFVTCTIRKWVLIWAQSVFAFSHLPSLLDFCIRTIETPFYVQFHARSPYNLLLTIVLCTWVPGNINKNN